LHLLARERAGYEPLVKGVLVVVALLADSMKPADELLGR
jgi:hypothetical protein